VAMAVAEVMASGMAKATDTVIGTASIRRMAKNIGNGRGDWHNGQHDYQRDSKHGKPESAGNSDKAKKVDETKRQHENIASSNEHQQVQSEKEQPADGTTGASEHKGGWEHKEGEHHYHHGDGEHPYHGDGARYHRHDTEVAANDSSESTSDQAVVEKRAKPEKRNWKHKHSEKPEEAKSAGSEAATTSDKDERVEKQENAQHVDGGTGASRQIYGDTWTSFENWQTAYDAVKAKNQNAPSITVSEGQVEVSLGNYGNNRATDSYTFDSETGKITGEQKYADKPAGDKMRGWIYAIHTGAWAGIAGRILAFLAALLGASLPLTGYYIWLKRICTKRK